MRVHGGADGQVFMEVAASQGGSGAGVGNFTWNPGVPPAELLDGAYDTANTYFGPTMPGGDDVETFDLAKAVVGKDVVARIVAQGAQDKQVLDYLVAVELIIMEAIQGEAHGFIRPEIGFASLDADVNGYFKPGEPGRPGQIVLSRDLKTRDPEFVDRVVLEELGEALAEYLVTDRGIPLGEGDVGHRLMKVFLGEPLVEEDFDPKHSDKVWVRSNQYNASTEETTTTVEIWDSLGVTEAEYNTALADAEAFVAQHDYDDSEYLTINSFDEDELVEGNIETWQRIVDIYGRVAGQGGNNGLMPYLKANHLAIALLDGSITITSSGHPSINFDEIRNESLVTGIFQYIEDRDNGGDRLDQLTIEQIDAAVNEIMNDFHAIQADRDFEGLTALLSDGEGGAETISRSALLGAFKGGVLSRNTSIDKGDHVSITVNLDETPAEAIYRYGPEIQATDLTLTSASQAGDVIGSLSVVDEYDIDPSQISLVRPDAENADLNVVDGQLVLNTDITTDDFAINNGLVSEVFHVRDTDGNLQRTVITVNIDDAAGDTTAPDDPGLIGTGQPAYGIPANAEILSSHTLHPHQNHTGHEVHDVMYKLPDQPDTTYAVKIGVNDPNGHVFFGTKITDSTGDAEAFGPDGSSWATWNVKELEESLLEVELPDGEAALTSLLDWADTEGHIVLEGIATSQTSLIAFEDAAGVKQIAYTNVEIDETGSHVITDVEVAPYDSAQAEAQMKAAIHAWEGDLVAENAGIPHGRRSSYNWGALAATAAGITIGAGLAVTLLPAIAGVAVLTTAGYGMLALGGAAVGAGVAGVGYGMHMINAENEKQRAKELADPPADGETTWQSAGSTVIDVSVPESAGDDVPAFDITTTAGDQHQAAVTEGDEFVDIIGTEDAADTTEPDPVIDGEYDIPAEGADLNAWVAEKSEDWFIFDDTAVESAAKASASMFSNDALGEINTSPPLSDGVALLDHQWEFVQKLYGVNLGTGYQLYPESLARAIADGVVSVEETGATASSEPVFTITGVDLRNVSGYAAADAIMAWVRVDRGEPDRELFHAVHIDEATDGLFNDIQAIQATDHEQLKLLYADEVSSDDTSMISRDGIAAMFNTGAISISDDVNGKDHFAIILDYPGHSNLEEGSLFSGELGEYNVTLSKLSEASDMSSEGIFQILRNSFGWKLVAKVEEEVEDVWHTAEDIATNALKVGEGFVELLQAGGGGFCWFC